MKTTSITTLPKINLLLFYLFCSLAANAQITEWVRSFGGGNEDLTYSDYTQATSALDADNNIYLTGTFNGTVDFDPGPDEYVLTASGNDIFILKLDAEGNLVWANSLDYEEFDNGTGIVINKDKEVYVTGITDRDINNFLTLTITKLSAEGNIIWDKKIDLDGYTYNGITIDDVGNLYLVGGYFDPIDVDPGPGSEILKPVGNGDSFLLKLNESGELIWVKTFGGKNSLFDGGGLNIYNNSIYMGGVFRGTVDVDPGDDIFNLTASEEVDSYILQLDTAGNFLNVIHLFGKDFFETDAITSFAVDTEGSIYTTGFFDDSLDIRPGPEKTMIYSEGLFDAFILKISEKGDLLWYKAYGGSGYDSGNYIELDADNNSYVIGGFSDTVNFGTEENQQMITSQNNEHSYVLKLTEDGDFEWIETYAFNFATSSIIKETGTMFISGYFQDTVDFAPHAIEPIVSNGGYDVFIQKLSQDDGSNNQNNAPEVVSPLENQNLQAGFGTINIELKDIFSDADGDDLNLSVSTSDENVITATIADTTLTLTEIGIGTAEITVTADDGKEGKVNDVFTVQVQAESNTIPVVSNPIEDLSFEEGFSTIDIDLDTVFSDADGDDLSFTASSSDKEVIAPTVSESLLTLTEKGIGIEEITITTNDSKGGTVSDTFKIEVKTITSTEDEALSAAIEIFPNPADEILTIKYLTYDKYKAVTVRLLSLVGEEFTVPYSKNTSGFVLNVNALPSGVYIIWIQAGDASTSKSVVIK